MAPVLICVLPRPYFSAVETPNRESQSFKRSNPIGGQPIGSFGWCYRQCFPCWLHTYPSVHLPQFTQLPKSLIPPRPLHA
jgi:hypothetical protein